MRVRFAAMGVVTAAAFCFCALCMDARSAMSARAWQEPSATMARSEQTQVALASGTVILGEMNTGLDSKKAKVGDKFTARTTEALKSSDGRTIMPRGTKMEGHVTQAEARNKGGTASTLGLQFDKAILKDGTEIP
jgi:hypothetical protein